MSKKIGIIANSNELKETIESFYSEDIENGNIIIDILDPDRINEQGAELERKGAKAIIARSGGYHYTLGKVNVPVINLEIYTQDILYAIMVAEKFNKRLVLVLSTYDKFNYSEWKELIPSELIVEVYQKAEEIEGVVSKYKETYDQVVIIGGGFPCSYAKSFNMDYVNIISREETIRATVSRAWQIVDNIYEQRFSNSILRNVLDHVHDAVVAVDKEGNIIFFNERAEKLFKKNKADIINKRLEKYFPELSFICDALDKNQRLKDEIVRIKDVTATANISPIAVDGQIEGVLCTFQDITQLQGLEKKVRFEMNKKGLTAKYNFSDILTQNSLMIKTLEKAVKIGKSDSSVIIYGESGTGKELISQGIHNISKRKGAPFVAVNCAALTESLLESELFGYEEGSFTGARKGGKPGLFELAHGGTIFLDEINSISINLQTKLLRVLEEKEVMRIGSDYVIPLDVRVLAAANENLKDKIIEGSFRKDLFYRLSVLSLTIPPLRNRKDDIIPLFENFLSFFSKDNQIPELDIDLEKQLINYSWPGNVRELRNAAESYVLLGEFNFEDHVIREESKELYKVENISNNEIFDFSLNIKEINSFVEQKVIEMLEKQGMSKNDIAKVLGISRATLWQKTKKENLS
jgi:propionate catabolism operon transcriptional regulator